MEEDHGKIYDQSVRPGAEVIEKTAIDIYVYEYVEPDIPDIPDFPDFPDNETAGTAVLWVKLDETTEFSDVVILSMGEVLYEQTYLSEYGTVPVTLEGVGSSLVSIYVNGILVDEKIAVYE